MRTELSRFGQEQPGAKRALEWTEYKKRTGLMVALERLIPKVPLVGQRLKEFYGSMWWVDLPREKKLDNVSPLFPPDRLDQQS